jgi:diguanylate cyclase (GGDEF)-like protein
MVAQPSPQTADAGPVLGRTWLGPDGRVAALTVGLGAVAWIGLAILAVRGDAPPTTGASVLWLPVLVVLFAVTEGFAVHIPVRRGGHALSLGEIPMVLAIVYVDPVMAIASRIVGAGAGLVLVRRQRGAKLAFNTALLAVQGLVAVAIFHALAGGGGSLGVREWLAAYVAMLAADAIAVILVTTAIGLHDDPTEWRRLPAAMRSVPSVAVPTTIALLSVVAVARGQWAAVLLAAVGVLLYLAYRAYVRNHQGRSQVERLYAFTRMLDGLASLDDLVGVVLEQSRDQLRAQHAELFVPATAGGADTRIQASGAGPARTSQAPRTPADAWWAPALLGKPVLLPATPGGPAAPGLPTDGMAVPVPFGETTAALIVTDSLPDVETFDERWLRLFQALANHAGVSLARASLVDRLRREAEAKEHQALHDPLTGLPNRRQFHDLLGLALEATRNDDNGPAIIVMDLDRFKEINDALGHDTGDAMLVELAHRLRHRAEGRGRLARLGGDEFAVLLPRVRSVREAMDVANDLVRDLEPPVQLGPLSLTMRASVGIAVAPDHGDDALTLIRRADVAMYAAKTAGHTTPRVYAPEEDENTPQRLALIADLRDTIESQDVLVVFQPKLDPMTGAVTGAEALARWRHAVHGAIPPDQFIPLAEHAGLIPQLTLNVLREALQRCAEWRRNGHALHVAVNLSPSSLLDTTLASTVATLLREARLPGSALTLEITENSIMANPAESRRTLEQLDALGITLSIDDFGTGYSSLGRLRELPIHEMKIDKSFIQRTSTDPRDRAVVRSAIQLGHALHLDVVAEGVEDQETFAYLAREGCNTIQGYLVSRPLTADEFSTWLASRSAAAQDRADHEVNVMIGGTG